MEIVKIQILPDFLSNNENKNKEKNKNRKQKYLRSKQKQPKASIDATLHYNNISPVKSHTIYSLIWAAVTTKNTRWCKDQLQDSIANKGIAWPNYRQSSFPS